MIREPSIDYLVAVLKMSHFFICSDGFQYATATLDMHTNFTNEGSGTLRLHLGTTLGIPEWARSAFNYLVVLPTLDLPATDAGLLDSVVLLQILNTREKLQYSLRKFAFDLPWKESTQSEDNQCTKLVPDVICKIGWEIEWSSKICTMLFHPELNLTIEYIVDFIDQVTKVSSVCQGCLARAIEAVKETPYLSKREDIIGDGFSAIRRIMMVNDDLLAL
jgi:hypothetical protein